MEGNIDNKTSERIRLHQSYLCGVLILLTVLITDPTPAPFFASKANKFERPSGARLPVAFPLHGRGVAAHITNLTGGWTGGQTGGVTGGITGGLGILKSFVHQGFRRLTGGVGTFYVITGFIRI